MKRPAIFIDRDGTLVEEVNYLSRVEDLRVYDFSKRALDDFKAAGYLVIVVTNQSGIGRGIYSADAMHTIHSELQHRLGGSIDAFYFCPHLPDEGCRCRKPSSGMIDQAMADFDIDLPGSWMVGDKKIDVDTGLKLNILTAMVLTGYGKKHLPLLESQPDVVEDNLGKAAKRILEF
jgi:D-glycero-D-manno-heptose 1,7-bisphosphate phosphatase